ncbi:MAG TPA: hypothetical protein PKY30_02490 [Myxococcota bacterium]|nr:hypothetical protein [Myxococcota bacterium]HND28709.1 hypothetical protein [Myxococcota bacterium]HNH45874.1 hypothetical protein [Myxococcota bacterium]
MAEQPPEQGSDSIRTLATFMAGVLVGGALVYFAPPTTSQAPGLNPDAQAMQAPGSPPGAPPDGAAPGTPGSPPGTPGTPGGEAGTPPEGAPGAAGTTPGALPEGAPTLPDIPLGSPGAPPNPEAAAVPVGSAGAAPAAGTPADGGVGTPLGPPLGSEAAAPNGAAPPPRGPGRLEVHLRAAPEIWAKQLAAARANPKAQALVPEIQAHTAALPIVDKMMPPIPEVAAYLASSRVLVDKMKAAGMDVAELSDTIDLLLRPPKGVPAAPPGR